MIQTGNLMPTEIYLKKDRQYFSWIRWDIIESIPNGKHNILDVGCGEGWTLKKLKDSGKAKQVIGIEINENAAKIARNNVDFVITTDVELLLPPFKEKIFDYIIFGDVLEHLINPKKVLEKYSCYLKDNGYIIASLPNIRYIGILIRLFFFGEFEYVNAGILDESHLRFFTKKSIYRLFKQSGLEIVNIKGNCAPEYLNILTLKFFESFLAGGFLIKARKKQ